MKKITSFQRNANLNEIKTKESICNIKKLNQKIFMTFRNSELVKPCHEWIANTIYGSEIITRSNKNFILYWSQTQIFDVIWGIQVPYYRPSLKKYFLLLEKRLILIFFIKNVWSKTQWPFNLNLYLSYLMSFVNSFNLIWCLFHYHQYFYPTDLVKKT